MTEVYKSGTKVNIIGCENLPATITAVTLRDNLIKYEISYFHDSQYMSVWLSEYEFSVEEENNKVKIGFK